MMYVSQGLKKLRCQIDNTATERNRSVELKITVPGTNYELSKFIDINTAQTFADTAPWNPLTLVFGDTNNGGLTSLSGQTEFMMNSNVATTDYLAETDAHPLLNNEQYTTIFRHAFKITNFKLEYNRGNGVSESAYTQISEDSFLQIEE